MQGVQASAECRGEAGAARTGYRVQGVENREERLEQRVQGTGYRAWSTEKRLEQRVQGTGYRAWSTEERLEQRVANADASGRGDGFGSRYIENNVGRRTAGGRVGTRLITSHCPCLQIPCPQRLTRRRGQHARPGRHRSDAIVDRRLEDEELTLGVAGQGQGQGQGQG